jgi:predicted kinase
MIISNWQEFNEKKKMSEKGTLILFVGISGSGKSHYIRNTILNDFPEIQEVIDKYNLNLYDLVVCPDDIRREITGDVSNIFSDNEVWMIARKRVNDVIKAYGLCIFDATNIANKSRKKFLRDIKCDKKCAVVLKPDVELSKARIKKDIEDAVDRSKVPEFVIDRQFNTFKTNLVGDEKWNGEWTNRVKEKIRENLKEFDVVKFT